MTNAIEQVKVGTKIISNKMVMIVTGENEKMFFGYFLYKGKNAGECTIHKSIFNNPHYKDGIQIIND